MIGLLLLLAGLRETAVVIKARGDVKVVRAKGETVVSRGMILKEGDEIRTGENGIAIIKYLEKGIIVEVKPNSSISFPIEPETPRGKLRRIKLFFGEILSIIKGKTFEVETPNSIAAVKGTKFTVCQTGDTTWVYVTSGTVELKNTGGKLEIGPGEAGMCIGDNPPVSIQTRRVIRIEFENPDGNRKFLEIEME